MDECHICIILLKVKNNACEIDRRSIPLFYLSFFVLHSIMGIHYTIFKIIQKK